MPQMKTIRKQTLMNIKNIKYEILKNTKTKNYSKKSKTRT